MCASHGEEGKLSELGNEQAQERRRGITCSARAMVSEKGVHGLGSHALWAWVRCWASGLLIS